MKYLSFVWVLSLGLFNHPFLTSYVLPVPSIEQKIMGKWHLLNQEMLINGKEVDQHFEEVAAVLSSRAGHQLDPYLLADKFRKGFRGIPSGTIFEFNDDFSYRISMPDGQIQQGLWRVKNAQTIILNAQEQEMYIEIRSIGEELATISIKEEKTDSEMNGGRYVKMELVIDLSR
ncbi:hypothetical protein [Catalinimonas niigatensis]|uniref:hypothetical protein n=1 Tax=Catalinimonas niigatensis TaxID=1397264 RepID=UPI0026659A98|nr:hypothetical protein [Catalinimonas niigatensis]WPP50066.1 hypothetical protein PZB72_25710 [Catalinimonas niigatensis]